MSWDGTEHRTHAWRTRERIALWAMAALIIFTGLAFVRESLTSIQVSVIEYGQVSFSIIVLSFVIGKAGVEAATTIWGKRNQQ